MTILSLYLDPQGIMEAPWGSLGTHLGHLEDHLGPIWVPMRHPWDPFSTVGGSLGTIWDPIGNPEEAFGPPRDPNEAIWGRMWSYVVIIRPYGTYIVILESFGTRFLTKLTILWDVLAPLYIPNVNKNLFDRYLTSTLRPYEAIGGHIWSLWSFLSHLGTTCLTNLNAAKRC